MAKSEELIRYISQKVAAKIMTPKQEKTAGTDPVKVKEPWRSRWFGMIPYALEMWLERVKSYTKK
ncbi:YqzE family protein [Paenibacillus turpanensis]|uniref:YqzE family protein n=1 Tax=Paenibacillus turpanensis TaxID=2689078 RepID=UPI001408345A|nr:YqzE family protein [Paenibacillus turpanensis]